MADFNGTPYTFASFAPWGYADVWDQFWDDVLAEMASRAAALAPPMIWDAGTVDANPGAGKIRASHAVPSSVTFLCVSTTSAVGADVAGWLDGLDDSTSAVKGLLGLGSSCSQAAGLVYRVTGAVVAGAGYRKIPVALVAGIGGFAAGAHLSLAYRVTGDKGDTGAQGPVGPQGPPGGGAAVGSATPQALGPAAVGVATSASREDHVHGMPTAAQIGALAQGKHTIWVPAAAMTARTTNGAAPGSVESATNKVMRKTLDFDTATNEYAQFTVAMPKSWNEGTVSFQALWTATSGSGGVVWGMQAVAISDLDSLDVAFGTAQVVTDTLGTAGYLHQTAESAAVTVAGSPTENDLAVFQIYRDVAHASDTLGVDALLLGVRVFYSTNAGNDA